MTTIQRYELGSPVLPPNFWSKVTEDENGCWIWKAALNSRGYGQFAVNQVSKSVHRVAYMAFVGDIADGLTIDHLCRVKHCCNPAHLEVVTTAENTRRAKALITHCPKGHPYSGHNLLVKKSGSRNCRACLNAAVRAKRPAPGRNTSAAYHAARRAEREAEMLAATSSRRSA